MKKTVFIMTIIILSGIITLAESTLIDRGGGLIYCDTLDITLLQNANYGAGSIYDDGTGYAPSTTDGKMTWNNAMAWADNLTYYDSVRDVIWDDWRLPSALNQDGSGPDSGFNVTGSEMGHIYYTELGNIAGGPLTNIGDFDNVVLWSYWTSTPGPDWPSGWETAYRFYIEDGHQFTDAKVYVNCAWAVRDGDVGPAPVPEPSALLLLFTGLIGLVGIKKKFKA